MPLLDITNRAWSDYFHFYGVTGEVDGDWTFEYALDGVAQSITRANWDS